jgi:hypothetical protein
VDVEKPAANRAHLRPHGGGEGVKRGAAQGHGDLRMVLPQIDQTNASRSAVCDIKCR